jgi:DNA-directed RNA polymerase subunit RPC12/RpoP
MHQDNTRGKRKYVCNDCQNVFFLFTYQTYNRFREHCPRCGSISIDLSTNSMGRKEIKSTNEVFIREGDGFKKIKTRKL